MTISGIATVYKVHPTGGGQKHAKQPRHEHHHQTDEHGAPDASHPAAGANAAAEMLGDADNDAVLGKTIDVSA
jgi:hypothetical protein